MAEGDEEGSAAEIMEKVQKTIKDDSKDFKVTTLGHIQRGGSPTGKDRMLASRCGMAAVDGLLEGKVNCMAGIIHDEIVYTNFEECISKNKPLNKDTLKLIEILSI